MVLKGEVERLRLVPLFGNVAAAKLKLLAFTSQRLSFREGHILFHQGDPGDAAYVVLSGTADVLVGSDSGEIKVASVGPNSIIGEIAILCDVNRTATVRASAPLEVLRIDKDHFLALLAEFPEVAVEIIRVLANRLSQTTTELSEARSAMMQLSNKHKPQSLN
jgi:CRP-like cAMP-binding protein